MDAVLVREEDDEKNNVGQQAEQEAKDENQERKTVKKEVAKRAMPIIKPIVKHQQPMITRGRKQKLPNVYVLIQPETPPITSPLNVVQADPLIKLPPVQEVPTEKLVTIVSEQPSAKRQQHIPPPALQHKQLTTEKVSEISAPQKSLQIQSQDVRYKDLVKGKSFFYKKKQEKGNSPSADEVPNQQHSIQQSKLTKMSLMKFNVYSTQNKQREILQTKPYKSKQLNMKINSKVILQSIYVRAVELVSQGQDKPMSLAIVRDDTQSIKIVGCTEEEKRLAFAPRYRKKIVFQEKQKRSPAAFIRQAQPDSSSDNYELRQPRIIIKASKNPKRASRIDKKPMPTRGRSIKQKILREQNKTNKSKTSKNDSSCKQRRSNNSKSVKAK